MRLLTLLTVALLLAVPGCSSDTDAGKKDSSAKDKSNKDKSPPPPCHPGCFPAGTLVATPAGPRPIESIRAGEIVLLIDRDGVAHSGTVNSTFCTTNALLDIHTDAGPLRTTTTQPLGLKDGGFRPAGELVEGDVIWRWADGERRPARVQASAPTRTEAEVFNLVVGESAVFVAGGFLARGKPPLDETLNATK